MYIKLFKDYALDLYNHFHDHRVNMYRTEMADRPIQNEREMYRN
jgi:hypothetical protein